MDNQRTPRSFSTGGTVKRDTRQQQQKLVVILICIVIALLLVVFMTIIGTKIVLALAGGFNNADPSAVEYEEVTIDRTQTLYGPLAIVNETHEYEFPDKAAANLVKIWNYRNTHTPDGVYPAYKISYPELILVDGAALPSLHSFLTDFSNATNQTNTIVTSAYRTYDEQKSFQVTEGKSDHHTGYGVTLKLNDDGVVLNIYDNPEYYSWLSENAHKYGFVARYPEDKANITGISNYVEYFHYVGYATAAYMKANNICIEEFVAGIKSYSVDDTLEITDANGQDWLVYYAACPGDMATIKLPTNFTYTVSGDNEGGIIVCVSLSKAAFEQQQQQESESDSAAQ